MIEHLTSNVGFVISMFVVFVGGIGVGAAITDTINNMKGADNDENSK